MKKKDDWYRNDRWGRAEQKKFTARLNRCRGSAAKAQAARIKAAMLEASGDYPKVRAALTLLRRILRLWRSESDVALCHWQMARCFVLLEDLESALQQFQQALDREREVPKYLTGAWSDFAQLVVTRKLRESYGDVKKLLLEREKFFIFPADRFVAHACRSMIAWENGFKAIARDEAEKALAEVERPHENKGLVLGLEGLVERLRKIAR